MTDEELRQRVERVLDERLPVVVGAVADNVCDRVQREQGAVAERAREQSGAQLQAAEAERERREKHEGRLWKFVVAPIVAAALGGGGVGAWRSIETEGAVDGRVSDLEKVIVGCQDGDTCPKLKTKEEKKGLTGRMKTAEEKIEILGELHFQQLKVIVDQGDEQRMKLDAMSEDAKAVPVPPSVNDAREAVQAHDKLKKERSEKARAEEAIKKGDPFAGIGD